MSSERSTDRSYTETTVDNERIDPILGKAGTTRDLYEISTWESRSFLDHVACRVYALLRAVQRRFVLGTLVVLSAVLTLLTVAVVFESPALIFPLLVFTFLSVVPAVLIAAFVWYSDGTLREPLVPLLVTFFLGAFFSGAASAVNMVFGFLELVPLVGVVLFNYLIVAPGEELVKLVAIRVFAYQRPYFTAVIDGAVYGAAAGLGFATVENLDYILLHAEEIGVWAITDIRARTGAGHVIWSAIAGYYLGLAKYNPENAGPILVKGALIAGFFHGTHNVVSELLSPFPVVLWFGFQLIWHSIALGVLFRLLLGYRRAYRDVFDEEPSPLTPTQPLPVDDRIAEQLRVVLELHQQGLLTDDEYKQKRQAIIDQL